MMKVVVVFKRLLRVGIKRGYGCGQKGSNADADKRDKMRMRTKGIKCEKKLLNLN
jgi:hypothetical protein